MGETWFPPCLSGCPDLNWGPLRPERSALPGCATPRERQDYPTVPPVVLNGSAFSRVQTDAAAKPPRPLGRRRKRRLSEEVFDRLRANAGPFADQQMPAVGDHAQRGVEAARELEAVDERQLVVARAPEDERRAAKLAEFETDVVGHDRSGCADRVARQPS